MKVSEVRQYLNIDRDQFVAACKELGFGTKADYSEDEVQQLEGRLKGSQAIAAEIEVEPVQAQGEPDLSGITEQQKAALFAQFKAEITAKNAGQEIVNGINSSFQAVANNLQEVAQVATQKGFERLMHAAATGISLGVADSAKKYNPSQLFGEIVFTQPEYTALPTVEELKALMPAE